LPAPGLASSTTYWQELFDISKLRVVDHDEMVRIEAEKGDSLSMSTSEARIPENKEEIRMTRNPSTTRPILLAAAGLSCLTASRG
jgi:hypothetical protein